MPQPAPRVAVVWHGDPEAPPPRPEDTRYHAIIEALAAEGLAPEPVTYADSASTRVRDRLLDFDAALVWVNPISDGEDRTRLDAVLRDVASAGVWVTAHPDVILAMGTKDVLVRTRAMAWGTDSYRYGTLDELREQLPARLHAGPRVIKRHRGNGGDGVWKVELLSAAEAPSDAKVRALHAARGSTVQDLPFEAFLDLMHPYFDHSGFVVDQPFATRLADGMIRCYMVRERVVGFGHQLVTALLPLEDGETANPPPPPRLYYGADRLDLQPLRSQLNDSWIPELMRLLDLDVESLPVIWDADFLYGPRDDAGGDTYQLCEINVSSVLPFPDEALAPLAREVARTLARRVPRR